MKKVKLSNQSIMFWDVIKEIDWKFHYDPDQARDILTIYAANHSDFSLKNFTKEFYDLQELINKTTYKRKQVFAEGISHGADDCHFMDMPAHLIGLGQAKVDGYLKGDLIDFRPIECLSYMFHDDEEDFND